jgi:hypothetical protein
MNLHKPKDEAFFFFFFVAQTMPSAYQKWKNVKKSEKIDFYHLRINSSPSPANSFTSQMDENKETRHSLLLRKQISIKQFICLRRASV